MIKKLERHEGSAQGIILEVKRRNWIRTFC